MRPSLHTAGAAQRVWAGLTRPPLAPPSPVTQASPASGAWPGSAAWQSAYLAAAGDAQLPRAVDDLFERASATGFLGAPVEACSLLRGLGPDRELEVQLVPGRGGYRTNRATEAACVCPFCKPDDARQRAVAWRSWHLLVNAHPYAASQHMVVSRAAHEPQGFSPSILGDMIDLQRRLRPSTTLHYNGLAGNSQNHLHWQATREQLPLTRALDGDDGLVLSAVRKDHDACVDTFARGFFAGLLVSGSATGVVRNATRIVAHLDADPLTRGHYNLLLLPPKRGQVRLVVLARRASDIAVDAGVLGTIRLGAFDLAGRGVLAKDALPPGGAEAFVAAAARTLVRPQELSWLAALRLAPASDVLGIRLMSATA